MNINPNAAVDEIFKLYEKFGHADYIGEPVSQLEHMSQSAQLAMEEGFDDEVILAAFFHDIGHICVMSNAENNMNGFGVRSHEKIGADFLREKGFSERVAQLVESHVQAKRYLTFKYPDYFNNLSEASKMTLNFQGGIMSANEAIAFEKNPLFEISVCMRKWDELAKDIEVPILDLNLLKEKAVLLLSQ
ncbi:MAG TPA: HD domain-containing protein [Chryseolinea sp.]|nr:HD domain-containing protein [Chryseolinea sp.]HPH45911.1 HD domain-containing protein [Chryseolinea sp.]HPM31953.1 HD domain-containing protein [Chryseolinea sp.]